MDKLPIFTIWLTNKDWDAMPYLYEICIASWHSFNPNRKVIIYTNHKLHLSFLDRTITEVRLIQDYFPDLYENAMKLNVYNKAHQSDYIRYSILCKQDGIYLDTDVLLHHSLDKLLNVMEREGYPVLFPKEDANMICNCMIIKHGEAGEKVFRKIISNYNNNYVKHSYLFNSQKYLWLMARMFPKEICLYNGDTLFFPKWNCSNASFEVVKDKPYDFGIGYHLSGSNEDWLMWRDYLDRNCYNVAPNNEMEQLLKDVITDYMYKMKEADDNDKK